jgi:hypothetical protein
MLAFVICYDISYIIGLSLGVQSVQKVRTFRRALADLQPIASPSAGSVQLK